MVERQALADYLADVLNVKRFRDYAPNGLQVEGRADICKIIGGVTASQALLDAAVVEKADAVLVHHGYFWKGEPAVITGMKQRRIKTLLQHDINLFAYHLPLDAHPVWGNNARLGALLQLTNIQVMDENDLQGVGLIGELSEPLSLQQWAIHVEAVLGRKPAVIQGGEHSIRRVAWCTGGAQGYIDQAAALGADAYLSGELSEQTTHSAREQSIHYLAAGHHATERYGVLALGEHLAQQFKINYRFIEIENPA